MFRSTLLISAIFLAITGCANKAVPPIMTHGDPAVDALNESSLRIARAAEQSALAASVANKKNSVTSEYKINLQVLPPELRDPILLEGGFNGEVEIFLKSLSAAIGWPEPVVYGKAPSVPLLVTMTEQRRPPVYWFSDAGYQIGTAAEIIVDTQIKQVILTYGSGM